VTEASARCGGEHGRRCRPTVRRGGDRQSARSKVIRDEFGLGELLAATVTDGRPPKRTVIRDDRFSTLPEGVSRDLSSNAQALARAAYGAL